MLILSPTNFPFRYVIRSVICDAVCVCADGVNDDGLSVIPFQLVVPAGPAGPIGPLTPCGPLGPAGPAGQTMVDTSGFPLMFSQSTDSALVAMSALFTTPSLLVSYRAATMSPEPAPAGPTGQIGPGSPFGPAGPVRPRSPLSPFGPLSCSNCVGVKSVYLNGSPLSPFGPG